MIKEHLDTTSDEDTDTVQIPPKTPKEPVVRAQIHPRPSRKARITRDLKHLKQEDMIPTPQKPRASKRASDDSDLASAAKRRSLTRNAIEPKKVNYDVKFHPMDQAVRPNAPPTREAREEYEQGDEEGDDEAEVDTPSKRAPRGRGRKKANYDMTAHPLDPLSQTKHSRKSSSNADSPAPEESAEPFAKPVAESWELLDPLDQYLHQMQEGAPDNSEALPYPWNEVVNTLIKEGYFTRKQFHRFGGFSALRERYEEIRQVAQGDCADLEPSDPDDRRVYFQEGFDVFELDNTQTYVNPNIPKYMHGIKVFTTRDLARYEREYIKAQKNAAQDVQDTLMQDSSTQDTSMQDTSMQDTSMQDTATSSSSAANHHTSPPVAVTLGDPVDSDAVLVNALQNAIIDMDGGNQNTMSAEEIATALDEQTGISEDIVMAMDEYGQETPTPIILSGTASAAMTESPSASKKKPAAKGTVAPIASLIHPPTKQKLDEQIATTQKEELAAQSVAATKNFVNKQRMNTPSSSTNLIDSLSPLATATPSQQRMNTPSSNTNLIDSLSPLPIATPSQQRMNTALSNTNLIDSLSPLAPATPSQQLLQEMQKVPVAGKIVAGTPKKQVPISNETIPGTNKRQLQRGRRKIKAKPGAAANFEIHEDTPGNTPRPKQRRNAITLDILKENMPEELDEDGQRVTPDVQPILDAFAAAYDAGEVRRHAVAASPGGHGALQRSSPDPLNVASLTRRSESLGGVLPTTEDHETGAAAAAGAATSARDVQAHTGRLEVVIPRVAARRLRAADMM